MIKELSQRRAGVGPASLFPIHAIWEENKEKWESCWAPPRKAMGQFADDKVCAAREQQLLLLPSSNEECTSQPPALPATEKFSEV